jgi:hypothetical protein
MTLFYLRKEVEMPHCYEPAAAAAVLTTPGMWTKVKSYFRRQK